MWAYDVPTGYEIKTVFVGTDNGDNTVTPENFSSGTYDSSIFGPGTCYHATASEILKVVDYTYIAPPAVGESAVDAEDNIIRPTYVGANGKVIQWHSRSNSTQYGTISMNPVSTGKLVFGIDLNFGGNNTNNAPQIIFVDGEGNSVLQLGFNCSSGETEYFQYTVGADGSATNDGTVGSSKLRGKYTGHSIRDIVIDLETGDVVYTVDCIGTDGKRQVNTSTRGVNIGTGKIIAGIRLSRAFNESKQSNYIWADNIELYTVGVESSPHTYTVKAMAGSTELSTIQSGSLKAGQIYSVTVNEVIEKDGKFYRLDDNTVTNYTKSFTMGDTEESQTINYVEDEDIVFYSELENATYKQENATASGGLVRAFKNDNVSTTLDNGVYQILVKVTGSRHSKSGSWRGFSMSLGGVEFAYSVGQSAAEHSFSLIVPEDDQSLAFYKGYNESDWIDYIIVKKTADLPNTVAKTISEAGYATYCSPYNLDFTSVAGLTAYTAAVAENAVTFTEVDGIVPANTGILLKGDAKEYIIPVATTTSDVTSALVGTIAGTTVDAGAFVLMGSGSNGVGFYKTTAETFTLGVNTAYFPASLLTEAKIRFIGVDGEIADGISAINATENVNDGIIYNFAGQRVATPTRGFFIKNGKKFIVR